MPRLSGVCGFTATSLISGAIWAVWHYPIFIISDFNRGGGSGTASLLHRVRALGIGDLHVAPPQVGEASGPPSCLHAANNLLVQDVLTPLSVSSAWSRYTLDEFGCLLPIVALAMAVRLWRRRAEVELLLPERAVDRAEPTGFSPLHHVA